MDRRSFLKTTAATATLAAVGLPVAAADPLKIGFIYVGPVGDGGWTYQHDLARQAVEKEFGDSNLQSKLEGKYLLDISTNFGDIDIRFEP